MCRDGALRETIIHLISCAINKLMYNNYIYRTWMFVLFSFGRDVFFCFYYVSVARMCPGISKLLSQLSNGIFPVKARPNRTQRIQWD